jgi:riboflavin transporter FmnP
VIRRNINYWNVSINRFLGWQGFVYISVQDREKPSYVPLTIGLSSICISLAKSPLNYSLSIPSFFHFLSPPHNSRTPLKKADVHSFIHPFSIPQGVWDNVVVEVLRY